MDNDEIGLGALRPCRSRRDIEAENPAAAIQVDERIVSAVGRLTEFPESGRPGRIVGTRELIVPRSPYIVAYVAAADKIRILRILHGARIWPDEVPPE